MRILGLVVLLGLLGLGNLGTDPIWDLTERGSHHWEAKIKRSDCCVCFKVLADCFSTLSL